MRIENMIRSMRPKLVLFLLFFIVIQPACGDYLTFHADAQRTGNVTGPGPDAPDILWKTKITNHAIYGGAAVVEDRVYVCDCRDMSFSGEQVLACLDAADGSIIWQNPIGGKGSFSTPAVRDDRILVGSFTGDLYCVNATVGDTVWNRTLVSGASWYGLASSPLLLDDEIFATSFNDGMLHVLDFDGNEIWNITTTGKTNELSSPASWEGKVYFTGGDPALYCVDISSHSVLWTFPTDSLILTTPSISDGRVFFATGSALFAVDANTGEELWKIDLKVKLSSPAVSFGRVYIGTDEKTFDCYDALDGSLLWRTDLNGPVKSSPVVAGDLVYFGTNIGEGIIYALNAMNGSVVWTHPVDEFIMSSPTVSGGVLFFGTEDNYLYAFGPEPSKVIWKGEVFLPEGNFDLTAESGQVYTVDWRSVLGALYRAAEPGGFEVTTSDVLWAFYGLVVTSIGGLGTGEDESWCYLVNYPDETQPIVSPDLFELEDGDVVTFYQKDGGSDPEEALRVEMTVKI